MHILWLNTDGMLFFFMYLIDFLYAGCSIDLVEHLRCFLVKMPVGHWPRCSLN
jgi:hypothetical protein